MRESERERVGKSGRVRVRKPLRTAKEPALVLQYFPLNMSIVWNNNLGEIVAKRIG